MVFGNLPPGCPPDEAQPCLGEIFRLVPSAPIDEAGFVSHFERYPGREWRDECAARGLSVFLTLEAVAKLRKRVKGFRDHKIAFATLAAPVGVMKQTGNAEHHTWWPEDGVDLPSLFNLHPEGAV